MAVTGRKPSHKQCSPDLLTPAGGCPSLRPGWMYEPVRGGCELAWFCDDDSSAMFAMRADCERTCKSRGLYINVHRTQDNARVSGGGCT